MKETIFGTIAFILFVVYDLEQAESLGFAFSKIRLFVCRWCGVAERILLKFL